MTYYFFLVSVLIALLSASVHAQQTAARPDRGVSPAGAYSISDIEKINLENGNLNLSIPLASLPPIAGGKLALTVSASYNSKLWNVVGTEGAQGVVSNDPEYSNEAALLGGWQVGAGYGMEIRDARDDFRYTVPQPPPNCAGAESTWECVLLQHHWYKVLFKTPDGAEHELRPMDYPDYSSYPNSGTREYLRGYWKETPDVVGGAMRYYSIDGSYLWAVIYPTGNSIRWVVYLKDGTKITETGDNQQLIQDTNGNGIRIFSDSEGTHYRDEQTMREIKVVWPSSNLIQVTYKTVGGITETIDINLGLLRVQGKVYNVQMWNSLGSGLDGDGEACLAQKAMAPFQTNVIREIVFPETEPGVVRPRYSFAYNSDETETVSQTVRWTCAGQDEPYQREASKGMGSLSRITTPTGATVNYSYQLDSTPTGSAHYFQEATDIAREKITSKSITHDGITDNWTYEIYEGAATVINPDGSTTEERFYPYDSGFARMVGGTGKEGLVYSSKQSNKVLTQRHWTRMVFSGANQIGANINGVTVFNPVVDAEYTSLIEGDGSVKMAAKTFQYDYNGNLLETKEYDWVDLTQTPVERDAQGIPTRVPDGAVLLRTTTNSYYNSATTASSTNVYAKRALNNASPLILNAPQEIIVGAGRTLLSYDGQSYGIAPTIGNLTKASQFDDQGDANAANDRWIETSTSYDSYGNKISVTDANNHTTLFEYDNPANGLVNRVKVDPLNGTAVQTTSIEYDLSTGLVKKQTDPNGNFTEIDYTNQLTGQTDPFGRPGIVYSPAVTVNGTSQRRRAISTYEDHLRRVTVASDLKSGADGLLKSRTTQDQLGRTSLVEQSEDGSTFTISAQTIYEQMGRIIYQANPRRSTASSTDGWTRSTRDDMGRVTEIATFSGSTQPSASTSCDANSNCTGKVLTLYYANQTTVTDQAGKSRKSEVDALGRLTKVIEDPVSGGLNYETGYTYDALGNLKGVTQGTQTRSFIYSSLSRLVSATNPESGKIDYQYDAAGNLVLKIDPRPKPTTGSSLADCSISYTGDNIATCYKYDGLNRVESRRYNDDTPMVTYIYDTLANGKGRLTSVSSSVSTTSYTGYDALGRVTGSTQVTDGHTYSMPDYKYDLAGNLTSQQYPSGRVVSTSYDDAGRINGITGQKTGEQDKTYASSFSYSAHGAIASVKLGNDLWEHTSFNSRLQPVEVGLGASSTESGTLKLGFSYGVLVNNDLDATKNNGNLESQKITGAGLTLTQSYTYDALNRLKTFNETSNSTGGLSQTYDYDRWGNRAVISGYTDPQAKMSTLTSLNDFKSNNRIKVYDDNQGYDAAGNLKQVAGHSYTFDAENRMTAHDDAQTVGTIDDHYSYDGDGRRVKKTNGSVTTIFVYNLLEQMVAEYTDDNTSQTSGTSYFTSDHLGTPRVITNQQQAVISRHDYLPFGEEITAGTDGRNTGQGYIDDADGVRQKFTGKERDNETGLDYFLARYYSQTMGRFMSPDEFTGGPDELYYFVDDAAENPTFYADLTNPQSLNKYQYAYNNPLRYVDPDGHETEDQQDQEGPPPPPPPVSCAYCSLEERQRRFEQFKEWQRRVDEYNRRQEERKRDALIPPVAIPELVPTPSIVQPVAPQAPPSPKGARPHSKNKRKSNEEKHERGTGRKGRDYGGEKGDERRRPPRRPPGGKTPKGGWPPKPPNPPEPPKPPDPEQP